MLTVELSLLPALCSLYWLRNLIRNQTACQPSAPAIPRYAISASRGWLTYWSVWPALRLAVAVAKLLSPTAATTGLSLQQGQCERAALRLAAVWLLWLQLLLHSGTGQRLRLQLELTCRPVVSDAGHCAARLAASVFHAVFHGVFDRMGRLRCLFGWLRLRAGTHATDAWALFQLLQGRGGRGGYTLWLAGGLFAAGVFASGTALLGLVRRATQALMQGTTELLLCVAAAKTWSMVARTASGHHSGHHSVLGTAGHDYLWPPRTGPSTDHSQTGRTETVQELLRNQRYAEELAFWVLASLWDTTLQGQWLAAGMHFGWLGYCGRCMQPVLLAVAWLQGLPIVRALTMAPSPTTAAPPPTTPAPTAAPPIQRRAEDH